MNNLKRDFELTTIAELSQRIQSIDNQIENLENVRIKGFDKGFAARHAKISKLVTRRDALWTRRALLLRETRSN